MRRNRLLVTSSFRLALAHAALTGLSFLILFAVIFWSTARFMRHQIDDSVSSEIEEIVSDSQAGGSASLQASVRGLARHPSGFHYLLQSASGDVLAGNLPSINALPGVREWATHPSGAPISYAALRGRGVLIDGQYLFVGWSTHQLREMEHMVVSAFAWGSSACIVLALAGGVLASRRLMRKIEQVSKTSRDIVSGDLKRRVPLSAKSDEFDHLAGSINAMLDRIQDLMNDLRQVTTDIAHDMRTPLTRLRQRLERAQRSGVQGAEMRDAVSAAMAEIDTLLEVFGALLRIAQIESGARRAGFTRLNLSDLLMTAMELYRSAAEEKQQSFLAQIPTALTLDGDHELLMQLFANLIENSIRHSPMCASIELRARALRNSIEVVVSDNGEGIPEEMRVKVLQRFVRLERSRSTPGSGLGLSLAEAITRLHQGILTLEDNNPGLRVSVSLPLY